MDCHRGAKPRRGVAKALLYNFAIIFYDVAFINDCSSESVNCKPSFFLKNKVVNLTQPVHDNRLKNLCHIQIQGKTAEVGRMKIADTRIEVRFVNFAEENRVYE